MENYSDIFNLDGGGEVPSELIDAILNQNYFFIACLWS
jgi:hypothetical protein